MSYASIQRYQWREMVPSSRLRLVNRAAQDSARLLLGFKLQRGNLKSSSSNAPALPPSFERLLPGMQSLAWINSAASKEQDYVLSVWVDWEQYQIPNDFQKLSAEALMVDALAQVHRHTRNYIPSVCPAGLLGSSSNTAAWAPADGEGKSKLEGTADLYGQFEWFAFTSTLHPSRIPLKILNPRRPAIPQSSQSYDEWTRSLGPGRNL